MFTLTVYNVEVLVHQYCRHYSTITQRGQYPKPATYPLDPEAYAQKAKQLRVQWFRALWFRHFLLKAAITEPEGLNAKFLSKAH